MDDIEEHLSHFKGKIDQEQIDRERIYLAGLSREKFEEIREQSAFERTYESNYQHVLQQQPKAWESIGKNTTETNVLIHIYNRTRQTFALTSATWASEAGSFDIESGGAISFTLPGNLLRRISSGKAAFKSSQVSHQFTYRSGDYAFNFTTASQLRRGYQAFTVGDTTTVARSHNIRSIGKNEILCEYILEQNQSTSPYSYAIIIQISEKLR